MNLDRARRPAAAAQKIVPIAILIGVAIDGPARVQLPRIAAGRYPHRRGPVVDHPLSCPLNQCCADLELSAIGILGAKDQRSVPSWTDGTMGDAAGAAKVAPAPADAVELTPEQQAKKVGAFGLPILSQFCDS